MIIIKKIYLRFINFSLFAKNKINKKAKIVMNGFEGNLLIDLKYEVGKKDMMNSFNPGLSM
tara:strand:- start:352 stop:534 length:183 start_codon:yes stop_codon:yes gene_type:complete